MMPDAAAFAADWIDAWNRRDLDAVLSHYAEDAVFRSPLAETLVGDGVVTGKVALRDYWTRALARGTDLHFTLERVYVGHGSLTIAYSRRVGPPSAETFEFDDAGQVVRAFACYA